MEIESSSKIIKKEYRLEAFPDSNDTPAPFRNSIAYFRQYFTDPEEDYTTENRRVSVGNLVHKQTPVKLFLIEQPSQNQCPHCLAVGWGNHYVTTRDFVLFIPRDLQSCDAVTKGSAVLHGLVHYNGFGHLLSINGRERGSELLSGSEIMDLWDRICSNLHIRKISLKDLAQKKNMEIRLVYGIANGWTWFAKWGYRFFKGRFGINDMDYPLLLDGLRDVPVKAFASSTGLEDMISFYIAKESRVSLGELFHVMLTMSTSTASTIQYENFSTRLKKSRTTMWTEDYLQKVAGDVVRLLRKVGGSGLSSEEICRGFGEHGGLVKHVLELLRNARFESFVVRLVDSKYCVMEGALVPSGQNNRDIDADLLGLYHAVRDFNAATGIEVYVKGVMNAIFFVKEFKVIKESDNLVNLFCHVRAATAELEEKFKRGYAPGNTLYYQSIQTKPRLS